MNLRYKRTWFYLYRRASCRYTKCDELEQKWETEMIWVKIPPFFVKTQIFFHHNSPKNSTRTCWIATIRGLLKNDQHTIWIKPYRHQRDLHSERSRDAQGACVVGAAAKNPSPASIIKRKKSALQITETWSCSSGVDNEILFWKCNESRTWLMRSFAVEETIGFGGNFKSTCTILEKYWYKPWESEGAYPINSFKIINIYFLGSDFDHLIWKLTGVQWTIFLHPNTFGIKTHTWCMFLTLLLQWKYKKGISKT